VRVCGGGGGGGGGRAGGGRAGGGRAARRRANPARLILVDVEEAPRLEPLEGRGAARARAPRRAA
jgi:hypothetical protein